MNLHQARMSAYKAANDRLEKIGNGATRVGRGVVAGFIGGAIAAYAMNRYREVESRPVNVRREETFRQNRGDVASEALSIPINQDPKVQVAQRISRKLFDHELSHLEQRVVAPAVHYGFAAAVGALYGGLAELIPTVGIGAGVPYAALLWLGADGITLPAIGVTKPPTQIPPSKHVSTLATHFVYGITLDVSRRILRRLL